MQYLQETLTSKFGPEDEEHIQIVYRTNPYTSQRKNFTHGNTTYSKERQMLRVRDKAATKIAQIW